MKEINKKTLKASKMLKIDEFKDRLHKLADIRIKELRNDLENIKKTGHRKQLVTTILSTLNLYEIIMNQQLTDFCGQRSNVLTKLGVKPKVIG
jgi:hypothetical protein